jgi:hypothetical protein
MRRAAEIFANASMLAEFVSRVRRETGYNGHVVPYWNEQGEITCDDGEADGEADDRGFGDDVVDSTIHRRSPPLSADESETSTETFGITGRVTGVRARHGRRISGGFSESGDTHGTLGGRGEVEQNVWLDKTQTNL